MTSSWLNIRKSIILIVCKTMPIELIVIVFAVNKGCPYGVTFNGSFSITAITDPAKFGLIRQIMNNVRGTLLSSKGCNLFVVVRIVTSEGEERFILVLFFEFLEYVQKEWQTVELLFNKSFTFTTDLLIINAKTLESVLYYLPALHKQLDIYEEIGKKVLNNEGGTKNHCHWSIFRLVTHCNF